MTCTGNETVRIPLFHHHYGKVGIAFRKELSCLLFRHPLGFSQFHQSGNIIIQRRRSLWVYNLYTGYVKAIITGILFHRFLVPKKNQIRKAFFFNLLRRLQRSLVLRFREYNGLHLGFGFCFYIFNNRVSLLCFIKTTYEKQRKEE